MNVRPPSHARLKDAVARWRKLQAASILVREHRAADAYRQCANDLELILRDDETIQPKKKS